MDNRMSDDELMDFVNLPPEAKDKFLATLTPERRRTFDIMNGICILDAAGAPVEDIMDFMRSECPQ